MGNTLLCKFFTDDPVFALGFECGIIWEQIKNCGDITARPIHENNIEQIQEICKTFGVECNIELASEGWAILTVEKFKV